MRQCAPHTPARTLVQGPVLQCEKGDVRRAGEERPGSPALGFSHQISTSINDHSLQRAYFSARTRARPRRRTPCAPLAPRNASRTRDRARRDPRNRQSLKGRHRAGAARPLPKTPSPWSARTPGLGLRRWQSCWQRSAASRAESRAAPPRAPEKTSRLPFCRPGRSEPSTSTPASTNSSPTGKCRTPSARVQYSDASCTSAGSSEAGTRSRLFPQACSAIPRAVGAVARACGRRRGGSTWHAVVGFHITLPRPGGRPPPQ